MAYDLVTGLSGGGGGATQSIPGLALTPAFTSSDTRFLNCKTSATSSVRLPGFSNNGDYLEISLTGTNDPISYYNSSGTLQWSIDGTNFGTSGNQIAGLCKSGSYIYAAYCRSGNANVYCGRVNSSGTVSNTATIATTGNGTFTFWQNCWFGIPQGKSNLYFLTPYTWASGGSCSVNISTGATITTLIEPLSPSMCTGSMVTTSHFNVYNGTSGAYDVFNVQAKGSIAYQSTANAALLTKDKFGLGPAQTAGWIGKWIYWDGYGIPAAFNGSAAGIIGTTAYNWSEIDAGYEAILDSLGLNFPNSDW